MVKSYTCTAPDQAALVFRCGVAGVSWRRAYCPGAVVVEVRAPGNRHFRAILGGCILLMEEVEPIMSDVKERVKQIIVEQLEVKDEEITMESSFDDDLGADSLAQIELVMALEEEFKIEIPDEEADKIRTVQQVIDYVTEHTSGEQPGQ